jgi:hypothetical protein
MLKRKGGMKQKLARRRGNLKKKKGVMVVEREREIER